jgi:ankyrin repeat protein
MQDIFLSITNGEDETLRGLLRNVNDVNLIRDDYEKITIAHHAASVGTPSIVTQVLAMKHIDLTVKDHTGKSPLHIAVECNIQRHQSESIVRLFLDAHASVSAVDNKKQTPLHIAILNKDIDSVRDLIEFGAPKDVLDTESCSPMSMSESLNDSFKFYMNILPPTSFPGANKQEGSNEQIIKNVGEALNKQMNIFNE